MNILSSQVFTPFCHEVHTLQLSCIGFHCHDSSIIQFLYYKLVQSLQKHDFFCTAIKTSVSTDNRKLFTHKVTQRHWARLTCTSPRTIFSLYTRSLNGRVSFIHDELPAPDELCCNNNKKLSYDYSQ